MDISVFSQPTAREDNAAANEMREMILETLLTSEHSDPSWVKLRTQFQEAVDHIAKLYGISYTSVSIKRRGGRGYNWDFDFMYKGDTISIVKVEFKYGESTIQDLPEFFNPSANKDFHKQLYAEFWYTNYLDRFLAVYGIQEKPSLETYMSLIHQSNYDKHPLFRTLYQKEADLEAKKKANKLVKESIAAFLEAEASNTKLSTIQEELKRSQEGKHFLLYDGTFHHDTIRPEELILTSASVRKGNVLVLTTPTATRHEMLLRWKNHNGILFPAWQISMKR